MSRVNFSFNIQVRRFTRLHGITNKCEWFQSLQEAKEQSVSIQKCLFCFSGERDGWCGLCQGETCVRLYFKLLSDGFVWWSCTAFPLPGSLASVAWSAFGRPFTGTAWDVPLQSSCKTRVINVGSLTVSQKQPALLKLYIAKPGTAEVWWGAHQNCTCVHLPWAGCASGLSVLPELLLPAAPAAAGAGHPPQRARAAEHRIPQQLCSGRGLLGACAGIKHCLTCMCVSRENKSFGKTNKFAFFSSPNILGMMNRRIN